MERYIEIIKKRLDNKRYIHSLQVAKVAKELALHNNVNPEKAYLAGLLHDYAKCLTNKQLLTLAEENNLISDEIEYNQPTLLHGPVGALLLEKELKIFDSSILDAVRYHTTGCIGMDTLAQIIYISDYIEPGRNFEGALELRKLVLKSLSQGVLEGMDSSLRYIIEQKKLIHPLTIKARNWMLLNINNQ